VVLLAAAVFVHVLRLRFAQKEPLHRGERLDARSLPRRGVETRRRTAGVVSAGRARLAFFGGESTLDVVEGHERDADAVRLGAGRDRARERGLAGAGKTAHRQQARARDITIRLHRRRRAHLVLMRDKASISSEVITPLQLSGAATAHSPLLGKIARTFAVCQQFKRTVATGSIGTPAARPPRPRRKMATMTASSVPWVEK